MGEGAKSYAKAKTEAEVRRKTKKANVERERERELIRLAQLKRYCIVSGVYYALSLLQGIYGSASAYIVWHRVVNQRPIRAFLHFHQMRRANA